MQVLVWYSQMCVCQIRTHIFPLGLNPSGPEAYHRGVVWDSQVTFYGQFLLSRSRLLPSGSLISILLKFLSEFNFPVSVRATECGH